jgi:hypothetical protein
LGIDSLLTARSRWRDSVSKLAGVQRGSHHHDLRATPYVGELDDVWGDRQRAAVPDTSAPAAPQNPGGVDNPATREARPGVEERFSLFAEIAASQHRRRSLSKSPFWSCNAVLSAEPRSLLAYRVKDHHQHQIYCHVAWVSSTVKITRCAASRGPLPLSRPYRAASSR